MSDVETQKARSWLTIICGILLIVAGVRAMTSPVLLAAPLLVGSGAWIVGKGATRLLRLYLLEQQYIRRIRQHLHQDFARASIPRRIFVLLTAIADVDGTAGPAEREVVRRFLLARFIDPMTAADLGSFEGFRIPPAQAGGFAAALRATLSPSECEGVFYWCCLVAFADQRFNRAEQTILQEVATGLGLSQTHAWRVFHHARLEALRTGQAHGQQWRSHGSSRPEAGRSIRNPRREALTVLGLPAQATLEDIRRRHRELVRQHHPDAHSHLGPVAAAEATERFRAIQQAYELLTASSSP